MQSLTFALFAVLLVGSMVATPAAAGEQAMEPHGFNVHDLVNMERVGEPQVSPDGRWVAFSVRTTDLEENRGQTALWRVGIDGKGLQRLTTHPAGASSPRWSPDGKHLYFLSSRSDSSQVWSLPIDGGEARQVTDLPLDVAGFVLSPDGKSLAVSMDVYRECAGEEKGVPQCTADRLEKKAEAKTTGQLYDQLFIRHWDTWKDGRRGQLFVVPVAGGEAVHVSQGIAGDIPSKPFGDMGEVTFTPDGKSLVFSARTSDREEAWSTDFDLYQVPADGSAAPTNLTPDNGAVITHPVFSPDGKTLAYLAMRRPGFEADRLYIQLRSWPDGKTRTLAEDWDRSVRGLDFSADGKTLFVTAGDTGHVPLFAIDVASGKVEKLVAEGTVGEFSVAKDHIVYGLDHLSAPVELFRINTDGSGVQQLTDVNAERLKNVQFGESEQFSFAGWNGETVYAWLVKPANFEEGKKYPVAFLIHGGPQGSFNNHFHYRWNPQTYAGAGYASIMVDFHGSTGYGQDFTDSISGDWGGKPLEDLQKGLAAALDRYDFLDGDRVGALGASYGGFMINWIAGQWPDRFRALVNHDGVFDQRMMYYATEELWFPEWENSGPYYESAKEFEKHNPVLHVDQWKTPMLVIHGALDFRVPETQGFAAFTALQRQGIPSQFLYFPDENHWVLKPHNSIQWHDTVLAWLDRWVKGEER
ncbi:MAG: S9 family peptidase [Acidobacteriota bacterium]|nr:S9 family peptidase [Acidobacteriota bacterium]